MTIRDFEEYSPLIAPTAYIDPLALVIGEVTIGEYASIWPMVVVRGDVQAITIGAKTNIQDNSVLHVSHDSHYCPGGRALTVGASVTVGHRVTLHACTIEHHCLIGIGTIVMDDAVVRPYSLLAAGTLVPPGKVLEEGYLWRGSPAQKSRPLTDDEKEYLDYSARYYVKLSQRHKEYSKALPI